ncbi:unnamed protein product [Cyprideis torosa]|uniref:Uncharacterized protein n=1 Tax=Cyprideis torosa TaxID=163714 RepID=A0A7R8ZIS1_9CRUS|nr:unnamed protein product [Cyprideis torosa]CAG0885340.1 unnamed protein product [Cyprideis torosa]
MTAGPAAPQDEAKLPAFNTKVIQVSNIAPQATRDQMATLFQFIDHIEEIRLYPTVRDVSVPILSRICYVRFSKKESVGVAQHLTNTVFIDRALIIIPVVEGQIPEEKKALQLMQTGNLVPGVDVKLPPHVLSQLTVDNPPVIVTSDPNLAENNLPAYPPLPSNLDTRTMEEIRRTLLVTNIDPEISPEAVIEHFSRAGEIKYLKMGVRKDPENPEAEPERAGLIEFTEQPSIIEALKMDKTKLGNNEIRVHHAVEAIRKPQAKLAKSNEVAQKEIEDAVKKAKDAQNLITASLDPGDVELVSRFGIDRRGCQRHQTICGGWREGRRAKTNTLQVTPEVKVKGQEEEPIQLKISETSEALQKSRTPTGTVQDKVTETSVQERRRNRSRSPRKRRSPSPPPRRRRTRSRSRTPPRKRRERERSRSRSPKRRNRRSRSRDKDEKKKSRRSRSASPSSSRKRKGSGESKVEQPKVKPRNYDEEEEFYEEKTLETMQQNKKKGEESDEDMSSKTSDGGGDKMEISDGED